MSAGDPAEFELFEPDPPGIGVWAAQFGSGQHRFWFVPKQQTEQTKLYDQVAGVLVRELGAHVLLSALWLYPPGEGNQMAPGMETFMLHLVSRRAAPDDEAFDREYQRLAGAVIDEVADRSQPSGPDPLA